MDFQFCGYDEEGNPTHVRTDDGYIQTSRKFDVEKDGWMLDQLSYSEFPIIELGFQVKSLVDEINYLRRENYSLKKSNEKWLKTV